MVSRSHFMILVLSLALSLCLCSRNIRKESTSEITRNSRNILYKGMTFVGDKYCPEVSYTDPLAEQSMINLAATGANYVAIVVTEYQDYTNSTEIYPLVDRTKHSDYYTYKTESLEGIEKMIDVAHRLGLNVMLKPHIDLSEEKNPLIWRGNIGQDFTSEVQWLKWFDSYEKYIVKYAKLAQRKKVEMFSMSCELIAVSKRDDLWRKVVQSVRNVYNGILTDSANHDGEEFEKTWWDVLDYIGVDAYYLSIKMSEFDSLDKVEAQLVESAEKLKLLSQKYKKQVIITEVGFCSGDCIRGKKSTLYQQYEQAWLYNKFVEVFNRYDFIEGYFWWAWNSDPNFGNLEDTCISPQNKFAETLVTDIYGGNKFVHDRFTKGEPKCACTI